MKEPTNIDEDADEQRVIRIWWCEICPLRRFNILSALLLPLLLPLSKISQIWNNRRSGSAYVMERIDRVVLNHTLESLFCDINVENYLTSGSDHITVILTLSLTLPAQHGPRRFHFAEEWTKSPVAEPSSSRFQSEEQPMESSVGRSAQVQFLCGTVHVV